MKQILVALFLTCLYFFAINCKPINRTPAGTDDDGSDETSAYFKNNLKETNDDGSDETSAHNNCESDEDLSDETINGEFDENCEDLNIMMHISQPILEEITKYFVAFNNRDLITLRLTCKWFNKYASKILSERIKPLVITNGTISGTTDQQIFSTYGQQMSNSIDPIEFKNFLALEEPQPDTIILFDNYNDPTPSENLPCARICLQITPYNNHLEIHLSHRTRGKLSNNHPRSGVIIPRHRYRPVIYDYSSLSVHNAFSSVFREAEWMQIRENVKLIIVFQNSNLLDISTIISHFVRFANKRPVPICCVLHLDEDVLNVDRNLIRKNNHISVLFFGSNVEVSTFLVKTSDEEELRKKLLEWKHGLDFLESHHITAFHFTKESMEPTNNKEIFREIFDIQPNTLQLSASEWAKTGLAYGNSTDLHLGPVYAIVGFKKFSPL